MKKRNQHGLEDINSNLFSFILHSVLNSVLYVSCDSCTTTTTLVCYLYRNGEWKWDEN